MDKKKFLVELQVYLESELKALKESALATYEAATHEENKPENEYDTRALEASYLAGAQAQRVLDIEEIISLCKFIPVKTFTDDDEIGPTAFVEVETAGKKSYLFFLPKGGGIHLPFEGKNIQIITPMSPLGEAMIGLQTGDVATIEDRGARSRQYKILSVR